MEIKNETDSEAVVLKNNPWDELFIEEETIESDPTPYMAR